MRPSGGKWPFMSALRTLSHDERHRRKVPAAAGKYRYSAGFFAIHQKERIASYEDTACSGEVLKPRLGEAQCANRSSLNRLAKLCGTIRLQLCVVLNLA
jgi:hypothetical protein